MSLSQASRLELESIDIDIDIVNRNAILSRAQTAATIPPRIAIDIASASPLCVNAPTDNNNNNKKKNQKTRRIENKSPKQPYHQQLPAPHHALHLARCISALSTVCSCGCHISMQP